MDIGVDYYPEHWDRKDWEPHARLMTEAGIRIVRLAEFAWSKMEPREGKYDFQWLDDAIAVLRAQQMKIILGTPTASPPPWLAAKHPEILAVNQDGVRTEAGGRRHVCFSSKAYREASRRIVTAMAGHFATHPSVVGWQTDNEIGDPRCWCDLCAGAFREWLKARYGSLQALNAAWGTIFWGQEFSDWNEIPVPREKHAIHGPSIRLDAKRWHSDSVLSFHDAQVEILRKACANHWITHNGMGFYDTVNYWDLAKKLDVMAHDFYPGTHWGEGKHGAPPLDYIRSLKHKPWMVMEQRSGLTGWMDVFNSGDQPGQLRLWSYQAVAHGADSIVYFRWRTSRFGIEQYWHGILDHHGQPGRRYREVSRIGKELGTLGDKLTGAAVETPAGILLDPESRWALDIQKGSPHFSMLGHANLWHRALHRQHLGVEYWHPTDDFSSAKLLVVPTLFLCDEQLAAKLTDYVTNGGTLVLTFRSGVKDAANVVINDRLPGPLKSLAGAIVEEYDAHAGTEQRTVDLLAPLPKAPAKTPAKAEVWCDQLRLQGAKAIAKYADGPFKGSPAASHHAVGKGQVFLIGFQANHAFYDVFIKWLAGKLNLASPFAPSDDIEIMHRRKGKDVFTFVLNHTGQKLPVKLPARTAFRDLITGQRAGQTLTLEPYGVRILAKIQPA